MTIPDQYKTDHLILLIGGNPLPNYVAARLLARSGAHVYLVHTQRTFTIAQRLTECLLMPAESEQLGGNFVRPQHIQVDERNPHDIFSKVYANIRRVSQDETVGLNYTSGNRPMSVHAYDAVKQAHNNACFSYLDANRLEMLIHDAERGSTTIRVDKYLNMRLETLFTLQGLTARENIQPISEPVQPKLAATLADLHTTDAGAEAWLNWRRNESANWTRLPEDQRDLEKVEAALRDLCEGDPTPEKVAQALGYSSLPSTTKWWKGEWLEDYVLSQLQLAIKGRTDTNDACKNIRIRDGRSNRSFELDVVVMRSYQLFMYSCTVSNNRQQCKDHLMEAYVRTRQAGGDEARVGLVCLYRDAADLQDEVVGELDASGKVKVFGQHDLLTLSHDIREWFDRQPS